MADVYAKRIAARPVQQPPDRILLEMDVETAEILRLVLCQVADLTSEGRKVGQVWGAIHSVVPRNVNLVAERNGYSGRIVIRDNRRSTL